MIRAPIGVLLVQIPCLYAPVQHRQMDCQICLPDRSGNFLAFKAETRKNTEKPEKTGFGMVNETAPGPVFCVFRPKIPRTVTSNSLSKVVGKR